MIIKVWGVVNGEEITFEPIPDKPDYWGGYANGVDGLQDIQIWAQNDRGRVGYLACSISLHWKTKTTAYLLLLPYVAELMQEYEVELCSTECVC